MTDSQAHFSDWMWRPNLIVFVSNFCIMVLELVAGRIIAPYVGVSLYTWTSIIGIVLAGISLGNYLGGQLADRYASMRLLGLIFLFGGLTSLMILGVETSHVLLPSDWTIIPRILAMTTMLFFVPATILGMTSPIVAKLAVRDLAKTGVTVGKIYAAGTVGSIAGTFAAGFVLIARFGTHRIVWGVAVVIISMGLLFLLRSRRLAAVGIVLFATVGSLGLWQIGALDSVCHHETNYFCIRIRSEDRDGEQVRKLVLDRLVHSFNSLDNPLTLTYDYERMYAEVTAYQAENPDPMEMLFIGGGGYTFPRYVEELYPDSGIDVIEIDPGVTEVAHVYMGLDRDTSIDTFNGDARQYLIGEPTAQYDMVFGDAFNDFSVPYHLTTHEFNQLVAKWMSDDGVYIINMIDGNQGNFLRAYVHTLQQTFDEVYVSPTSNRWRELAHSTFVILATNKPLDEAQLRSVETPSGSRSFVNNLWDSAETTTLLTEDTPILLTDKFAPVEQMLAPAFRDEVITD